MWHDILSYFYEHLYRCSSNRLRFSVIDLNDCNIGITDCRDSGSGPLRWDKVA
jgi:hypothetical protein